MCTIPESQSVLRVSSLGRESCEYHRGIRADLTDALVEAAEELDDAMTVYEVHQNHGIFKGEAERRQRVVEARKALKAAIAEMGE